MFSRINDECAMEKSLTPFDFIDALSKESTKSNFIDDTEIEKAYIPFIINRHYSQFIDTVMLANQMNQMHHLDNKMQFEFYRALIKKQKRFTKWVKKTEDDKNVKMIQELFGYSRHKAISALSILTSDQIKQLKKEILKGGKLINNSE